MYYFLLLYNEFRSDKARKMLKLTNLYNEISSDDIASAGGIQLSPVDETRLGKEIHNLFSEIGFIRV